jgi:site-specific DNA recombinase
MPVMATPSKPAGYARLSVAEKRQIAKKQAPASLSIRAQVAAAEELAAERGWPKLRWFIDDGVSASIVGKRPEFEKLIQAIESGEVDTILARDDDRFLRHPRELENNLPEWEKRGICAYYTEDESVIDFSTPKGPKEARDAVSGARYEGQRKSRRQKANNKFRYENGLPYVRRVPFGNNTVTDDDGNLTLVPDAPKDEAIREAARKVLSGASLASVAREWNERGFRTYNGNEFSYESVKIVLTNPVVKAVREYRPYSVLTGLTRKEQNAQRPKVRKGNWEPILDDDTWEAVYNKLNARHKQGGSRVRFLGSGIYYCGECYQEGSEDNPILYSKWSPSARSGDDRNRRYRCEHSRSGKYHSTTDANEIDEFIEVLTAMTLQEPGAYESMFGGTVIDTAGLEAHRERLKSRRASLARTLAKGYISEEDFEGSAREITKELDGISDQLAKVAAERESAERFIDMAKVAERWGDAGIEIKREAVKRLFGRIVIDPEEPDGTSTVRTWNRTGAVVEWTANMRAGFYGKDGQPLIYGAEGRAASSEQPPAPTEPPEG